MRSRLNAKNIHIYACAYSNFKKADAEKIFNETRWAKKTPYLCRNKDKNYIGLLVRSYTSTKVNISSVERKKPST